MAFIRYDPYITTMAVQQQPDRQVTQAVGEMEAAEADADEQREHLWGEDRRGHGRCESGLNRSTGREQMPDTRLERVEPGNSMDGWQDREQRRSLALVGEG